MNSTEQALRDCLKELVEAWESPQPFAIERMSPKIDKARALLCAPSDDRGVVINITPERAQFLLNVRDALVHNDIPEAWHFLGKFYNPPMDKYSDELWKDIEELAAIENHEKYTPPHAQAKTEGEDEAIKLLKIHTAKIIASGPEGCRKYLASFGIEFDDDQLTSPPAQEPDREGEDENI